MRVRCKGLGNGTAIGIEGNRLKVIFDNYDYIDENDCHILSLDYLEEIKEDDDNDQED